MIIDKEKINDKVFLDDKGQKWITEGEAGTGEWFWWCRNLDTDEKVDFSTSYVIERINSYDKDVENFKMKEKIENNMFILVKKMSSDILRKEVLDKEKWSNEDIDILNKLMNGKFDIKYE